MSIKRMEACKKVFFELGHYYKAILLSIIILNFSLAKAESDNYSPIIQFSGVGGKHRNIGETNIMLPLLNYSNNLTLLDLKFKADNQKSTEYNIGLVYRHNFNDKWIFGIYNYFDRRKTMNRLYVNQWTGGIEFLSEYLDGRFNIYISENKKKILSPSYTEFTRMGTKVFGTKKGAVEEHALSGYDFEIGFPVFCFTPRLNESIGTKFYVTKFDFRKKNIAKNKGLRFRLEQPVTKDFLKARESEIILSVGTTNPYRQKWNHFVGLSFRMSLMRNSSNFQKSSLKKRMTDNVVRDVDIVTSSYTTDTNFVPLFWNNKEIQNIYFVGDTDNDQYIGDGSYERPFSKKQFLALKGSNKFQQKETDLIVPIKLDKELNDDEYFDFVTECAIINTKLMPSINFTAEGKSFNLDEYFPNLYKSRSLLSFYETEELLPADHAQSTIAEQTEFIQDNRENDCEESMSDYNFDNYFSSGSQDFSDNRDNNDSDIESDEKNRSISSSDDIDNDTEQKNINFVEQVVEEVLDFRTDTHLKNLPLPVEINLLSDSEIERFKALSPKRIIGVKANKKDFTPKSKELYNALNGTRLARMERMYKEQNNEDILDEDILSSDMPRRSVKKKSKTTEPLTPKSKELQEVIDGGRLKKMEEFSERLKAIQPKASLTNRQNTVLEAFKLKKRDAWENSWAPRPDRGGMRRDVKTIPFNLD